MDTIAPTFYLHQENISTPKSTTDKTTTVTLPNAWVDNFQVLWPPGGVALVGVRIVYNGVQIAPWDASTKYLFGHDERMTFPLDMYMPAPIEIHTHNGDKVAHSVWVVLQYRDYNASVRPSQPNSFPVVLA